MTRPDHDGPDSVHPTPPIRAAVVQIRRTLIGLRSIEANHGSELRDQAAELYEAVQHSVEILERGIGSVGEFDEPIADEQKPSV